MTKDLREEASARDFQTKMIPWHMLKLDESDSREEVLNSSRRLPMVVCASLLDRAPNIGGLTRTCEVFGLEAITISDLKVMQARKKKKLSRAISSSLFLRPRITLLLL